MNPSAAVVYVDDSWDSMHATQLSFVFDILFFAGIVFLNTPYFSHDQLLFSRAYAVSVTHAPHQF